MQKYSLISVFYIMASMAGCAGNHVDVTKTAKGFYSPTNPNNIEIVQTKPDRRYLELGTLTSNGWPASDTAKMYNALRSQGAQLGADAVLIVSSGQNIDPMWGTPVMWCNAVALKYQ